MPDILTNISELGGIVVVSTVAAYAVFRFLSKKWIEDKFSKSLEEFKHRQDVEIKRLHLEIDATLSGTLKIQDKEFETLTETWAKLDEAYREVASVVSPLQQYPDLDRMSDAQLEEFLERTELRNTQKDKIRTSSEKCKSYQDEIYWHRIHKAKVAVSELQTYVIRYGIFFPKPIKDKFDEIISDLRAAYINHEIGIESEDFKIQQEGWTTIEKKVSPMVKKIGDEIHAQLRSHGTNVQK